MTFNDAYNLIKDKYMKMDLSSMRQDFTACIYLTGDQPGHVYLAYLRGNKLIEPIRRFNADIHLTLSISTFEQLVTNRLDPFLAFTTGQVQAKGNVMLALSLYNSLKQ